MKKIQKKPRGRPVGSYTAKKPQATEGCTTKVDALVGAKLKQRRTVLGYSQDRLGKALSITFQQVQKYEKGLNRIGVGRLWEISRVLDVPVSYFFEDVPADVEIDARSKTGEPMELFETGAAFKFDPMRRKETKELIDLFTQIRDPKVSQTVFDLIKSLAYAPDSHPFRSK